MHKLIDEMAEMVPDTDKIKVKPGESYKIVCEDKRFKSNPIKYEF